MRKISIILSLVMMGVGIYGILVSSDSTEQGYWLGALILGTIWLIVDIIIIKRNKKNNY